MNQISFSLKRAFRLSAELGFVVMREFGLTPSRLEVLLLIGSSGRRWLQTDLRERLGVNRTTISRFVRALEAAGFVHRFRNKWDRRTWEVCFTTDGHERFHRIRKVLIDYGVAELVGDTMCFVTPERREERQRRYAYKNDGVRLPKPLEPTLQNLRRVRRPLELIREALGDCATLFYPSPRRRRRLRAPSFFPSRLGEPCCARANQSTRANARPG